MRLLFSNRAVHYFLKSQVFRPFFLHGRIANCDSIKILYWKSNPLQNMTALNRKMTSFKGIIGGTEKRERVETRRIPSGAMLLQISYASRLFRTQPHRWNRAWIQSTQHHSVQATIKILATSFCFQREFIKNTVCWQSRQETGFINLLTRSPAHR